MSRRVAIATPSTAERVELVREHLARARSDERALLVGPSRPALDELAWHDVGPRGARFGLERRTVWDLANILAAPVLAASGRTIARPSTLAALARRRPAWRDVWVALADAAEGPASGAWAEALEAWLGRLAEDGIGPSELVTRLRESGGLADAIAEFARARAGDLAARGLADRAMVFAIAREALVDRPERDRTIAAVPAICAWIDVAIASRAEAELVAAAVDVAREVLVVVPTGDVRTLRALEATGFAIERRAAVAGPSRIVEAMVGGTAPCTDSDAFLRVAEAAGEGAEARAIAGAILEEARRGMAFEAMAIVADRPELYGGPLRAALDRAGIPAHFEKDYERPDVGCRALAALVRARWERSGHAVVAWLDATGDAAGAGSLADVDGLAAALGAWAPSEPAGAAALSRLRALATRFRLEAEATLLEPRDETSAWARWTEADRIDETIARATEALEGLDALPGEATWAEHRAALARLARTAQTAPERSLEVLDGLAELDGDATTFTFDEVAAIVVDALARATRPESTRPSGRVVVTTTENLRGRVRRFIAVAGLSEGVFAAPRRSNAIARAIDPFDASQFAELDEEDPALALRLALGAAGERALATWSTFDARVARTRTPSAFARGLEERVSHLDAEAIERRPSLDRAIDGVELDLAQLRAHARRARGGERGSARSMLSERPWLARAVDRARALTARELGPHDGLLARRAETLHALRWLGPTARAHWPAWVELHRACAYRYHLRTILGLAQRPSAAPAGGDLVRTALLHRGFVETLRRVSAHGTAIDDRENRRAIDDVVRAVSRSVIGEALADEPEGARRGEALALEQALLAIVDEHTRTGSSFETDAIGVAFGAPARALPSARPERPPLVGGRHRLAGVIDWTLRREGEVLAVVDLHAGPALDLEDPAEFEATRRELALLGLTLEAARRASGQARATVSEARRWYATREGAFESVRVEPGEGPWLEAQGALDALDADVRAGELLARPRDGCARCAFQLVCGPDAAARARAAGTRRRGAS